MAITKTTARAACPLFSGRGLLYGGFTIRGPEKTYLSCEPDNISSEKGQVGVYSYDMAEAVYNEAEDRRAFIVYAETGGYTDQITDAKTMFAADFFIKLTEDYTVLPGELHNADIRAISARVDIAGDLSGVATGAYIGVQFREVDGGATISGYYLAYTQTYGVIGLEVRTEPKDGGAGTGGITVGAAAFGTVGILVSQKCDAAQTGEYAAIAIHTIYDTGNAIVGDIVGIRFDNAGLWSGTGYDTGIEFQSGTLASTATAMIVAAAITTGIQLTAPTTGINIDACTMALDADVTLTAATDAVNINVTSTADQATDYTQALQITVAHSGDMTSNAELHGIAIDMATITGDVPYLFGETLYCATTGNPTIGFCAALSVYMGNMGTACENLMILDLQMDHSADDPSSRYCFIRMRSHNATYQTHYGIMLEGANGVEKLLYFDASSGGCLSAHSAGSIDYNIAVEIAGVGTRYIKLYDAA